MNEVVGWVSLYVEEKKLVDTTAHRQVIKLLIETSHSVKLPTTAWFVSSRPHM